MVLCDTRSIWGGIRQELDPPGGGSEIRVLVVLQRHQVFASAMSGLSYAACARNSSKSERGFGEAFFPIFNQAVRWDVFETSREEFGDMTG